MSKRYNLTTEYAMTIGLSQQFSKQIRYLSKSDLYQKTAQLQKLRKSNSFTTLLSTVFSLSASLFNLQALNTETTGLINTAKYYPIFKWSLLFGIPFIQRIEHIKKGNYTPLILIHCS